MPEISATEEFSSQIRAREPGHFLIGFKSRDVRKFEENRWISANPVARPVVVSLRQAPVRAVTLVAFLSCVPSLFGPDPPFPPFFSPFGFSFLTGVMRAARDTRPGNSDRLNVDQTDSSIFPDRTRTRSDANELRIRVVARNHRKLCPSTGESRRTRRQFSPERLSNFSLSLLDLNTSFAPPSRKGPTFNPR